MAYALGAVKPFVQQVADTVGPKLGVTTIYGWRATSVDMTGHPAGLALDLVVNTDKAKGDTVAGYFTSNAGAYQVKYVIWQQKIWTSAKPTWTPMDYRPGATAGYDPNHMHHVHVSFNAVVSDGRGLGSPTAASTTSATAVSAPVSTSILDTITNPLQGASDTLKALTSRETWVRVAQVLGGAALIWGGVLILLRDIAIPVAKTALEASPEGVTVKSVAAATGVASTVL